jgi:hypothetical protein
VKVWQSKSGKNTKEDFMSANKITFETATSINVEQALIIGRLTVGEQECRATYFVQADGSCELSHQPSDTDNLPEGMTWPKPPGKYVREAQELAKDCEDGE